MKGKVDWIFYGGLALMALAAVAIPACIWVVGAHFESKTYNRLTGANTTTWDAMWVELRVQDSPK